MPMPLANKFAQWELTPLETKVACQFNELQIALIQNEIARAALEKLALTFDVTNPLLFAQQEAELQGQIEVLEYLLSLNSILSNSNSLEGDF